MEQAEARNVHELVELSLYRVETTAYETLAIEQMSRPHWIVSHVMRGDVETETEGTIEKCRVGEVMIHPPGVPFSERAKGPGCHQWLELEMKVSPSAEVFRLYPVAYVVKLESAKEFVGVFEKLEATLASRASHTRDLRIVSLATDLIGLVLESKIFDLIRDDKTFNVSFEGFPERSFSDRSILCETQSASDKSTP